MYDPLNKSIDAINLAECQAGTVLPAELPIMTALCDRHAGMGRKSTHTGKGARGACRAFRPVRSVG